LPGGQVVLIILTLYVVAGDFADNAGMIGLVMSILVWISSYTAYL